jgi:hypothetical protein
MNVLYIGSFIFESFEGPPLHSVPCVQGTVEVFCPGWADGRRPADLHGTAKFASGPVQISHAVGLATILRWRRSYRLQITDWPHQSGAPERSQPRLHGQQ